MRKKKNAVSRDGTSWSRNVDRR